MSRPKVSEQLYHKLPSIYRTEDSKIKDNYPLPLKRFLQVLGVGLDYMEDKIDGHSNLYNIDKCPPEFLDKIVETLGFKFPYALPENEQRRFVKILPYLYKTKGSIKSFEYLAREIFGTQSSTKAYKKPYKKGMPLKDWRKIIIEIETDEEQLNLGRKEEYFRKFAELVRPVNMFLLVSLIIFYIDSYDRTRIKEEEYTAKIKEKFIEDGYRYGLFIDGVNQDLNCQHLTLSTNPYKAFILNHSHLYNGQKIEWVDRIKEEIETHVSELITDKFNKDLLRDSLIPFSLNQSHLGNLNYAIGHSMDYIEEIIATDTDNLSLVIRDKLSTDILANSYVESYRFRNFKDGVSIQDVPVCLTGDKESTFILNHNHLWNYNGSKFTSLDVIKEEVLEPQIIEPTTCDKYDLVRFGDGLIPFSFGTSGLNNGCFGLTPYYNTTLISNTDEDKVEGAVEVDYSEPLMTECYDDNYKRDIFINGKSIHDIPNKGLLSSLDHFKLNRCKLFDVESKVVEVVHPQIENLDCGICNDDVDEYVETIQESTDPFTVNRASLNNVNTLGIDTSKSAKLMGSDSETMGDIEDNSFDIQLDNSVDEYENKIVDFSISHLVSKRRPALLGDIQCKLGVNFYTNNPRTYVNLTY